LRHSVQAQTLRSLCLFQASCSPKSPAPFKSVFWSLFHFWSSTWSSQQSLCRWVWWWFRLPSWPYPSSFRSLC